MRAILLIMLWLCSLGTHSYAQIGKLNFNNISTDEGLPHKMVLSVLQDAEGYMWIGTAEGLSRYDGYNFKTFKHNPGDSTSISASWINCLYTSKNGSLWVGTEKGLDLYDREHEKFIRYRASNDTKELLSKMRIRCIFEDSKGFIWIGTLEGLIKLDLKGNYINFMAFAAGNKDKMANEVRAICEDGKGLLWIGTFDGLYSFDPSDNSFVRHEVRQRLAYDQSNNLISSLKLDQTNPTRLYVGTSNGLTIFNTTTYSQQSFRSENSNLSDNDIKCLNYYDKNNLIIATSNGLSVMNLLSEKFDTYNNSLLDPTSLPHETVWSIWEDGLGVIWLATSNGLAKIDKKRRPIELFRTTAIDAGQLKEISVNDIGVTHDRDVWLATNDGIIRYDSTLKRRRSYLFGNSGISHNVIKRILIDRHGILWIGTNNGVNYYDRRTDSFKVIENPHKDFSLKYIYDMKEDRDGDIVVNISSGVCFITPYRNGDGSITSLSFKSTMLNDMALLSTNTDVTYFDVDKSGNTWIGTINDGLFQYDKPAGKFTQYKFMPQNPNSINSNRIYTIHADGNGIIWVGTDMGICRLDPSTNIFTRFEDDLDLSQSIRTITSDSKQRLWIGTADRLIMYDYVYLNKIICDLSHTVKLNELVYNSFYNDQSGLIYMGGYGGFVRFDPSQMMLNLDKAPVVLSSVMVCGEEMALGKTKHLTLPHDQNSIRIAYALLNYASPTNNKYTYILEGYDKEWVVTSGDQNAVSYTNLSAGTYTFKVKGSNPDNIWSDESAELVIRIKPPFWNSILAWIVYAMAAMAAIWYGATLTMMKIRLSAELKLKKMERIKMEEINQIKMKFFTNISHEFKTPLSLILGPIESLREHISGKKELLQLDIMKHNGERLLRLTNQIMDLRRFDNQKMTLDLSMGEIVSFCRQIYESFNDYATQRNLAYDFETEAENIHIFFDRDKIEKAIYNLLSNAFKFTPDNGHISISLSIKKENNRKLLEIKITDSGVGIAPEDTDKIFDRFYQGRLLPYENTPGSGVGLVLTKECVELHGGTISVESSTNAGSCFSFCIPCDLSGSSQNDSTSQTEEITELVTSHTTDEMPRIMVVEDNHEMLDFIRLNLEDHYQIITAMDGQQAWNDIRDTYPDLVVTDIMMPNMDGLELCRLIKNDIITCHIPVILLTAKSNETDRADGYTHGADGYISKPFSIHTLRARIETIIQSHVRIREHYRQKILSSPTQIVIESENDKFISMIMQAIEKNIDNPDFGIRELCLHTDYSYQQIYRKIKALTGETINEFVRTVRLKRAAQYLIESDLRISEIIYNVGFNSHSYFTKCFREHFGVSPKEYAEKRRENRKPIED